jgi:hypothetical protein
MSEPIVKPKVNTRTISSTTRLASYIDQQGVVQSVSVRLRTSNRGTVVAACNKALKLI